MFFENTQCLRCGGTLGFLPHRMDLCTIQPQADQQWRALTGTAENGLYRVCSNGIQHRACNWMVAADSGEPFCEACRLNQIIPDLNIQGNKERWVRFEMAKRRVLYALKHLGLPTEGGGGRHALRFNFMADPPVDQTS